MKIPGRFPLLFPLILALLRFAVPADASECVDCHTRTTPGIVNDWKISRHGAIGLDCAACHGNKHHSAVDAALAQIPGPETCAPCHAERVRQYQAGKHALAWAAMNSMPTIHWQPTVATEGMKGCGGCHKIGVKTEDDLRSIKRDSPGFGTASCDACHTRHTFSVAEARQPQACRTCHMGFDHPQWEMYSASKHGVRFLLKQGGVLPDTAAAPACQTCHMPEGNHEVRTAWGFLGLRFPMPEDPQWEEDISVILQALHILGEEKNTTSRLLVVQGAQMARLNRREWQQERDRMLAACSRCHSGNFARGELAKGDRMIREADRVMAEAIRTVAALYRDGILEKPQSYEFAFPDLFAFHDAPTPIEQKLFLMFQQHRMRAFQGTFHANPDYAFWYGWSELKQSLTEIQYLGDVMRKNRRAETPAAAGR